MTYIWQIIENIGLDVFYSFTILMSLFSSPEQVIFLYIEVLRVLIFTIMVWK